MTHPTVSVVIPAFGRPDDLRRAVATALRQSYRAHEVIVVDDASPTPISAALLGTQDGRVKILRNARNVGAAGARQAGVEQATGDLIAFLDSDDLWFEDKIASQVQTICAVGWATGMQAVVCGWQYEHDDRFPGCARFPMETSSLVHFASGCWHSPGSTLLAPRRIFQIVGPFDPRLKRLEDLEWFLRFALSGGTLHCAPVIGAVVAKGRRARLDPVRSAAKLILDEYSRGRHAAVTANVRRHLRAWLHVEQAAAARNERHMITMLYHLAASAALVPRTSLDLHSWWRLESARRADALSD